MWSCIRSCALVWLIACGAPAAHPGAASAAPPAATRERTPDDVGADAPDSPALARIMERLARAALARREKRR